MGGVPFWLIGFATFFAATALAVAVVQDFVLEKRRVYRSLRSVREVQIAGADFRTRQLAAPAHERLLLPGVRRLGSAMARLTPAGVLERLRLELTYAGSPVGWDAERVLAMKVVAAVGLGVLAAVFVPLSGVGTFRSVLFALVFAAAGYYVPEWIVRSRGAERQKQIRRALPDSLDLLSITVEAGLGFDAALDRVSRESGGALGAELHRVVKEMQLGKSRSEALRGLAERSNVSELKGFVLAMIQADIFGISVGKVLQVQAKEIRIKRRQAAEEQAQKLPVKLVFPLIFCIFPSLFVILLGPAAIRIYDTLFGALN